MPAINGPGRLRSQGRNQNLESLKPLSPLSDTTAVLQKRQDGKKELSHNGPFD